MPLPDPLVLIPGLQSDHRSWVHQLRHFEGRRQVIVPRGHQHCDTIAAMAEHIMEQLPARFHLVAWSMGGYIALQMLPRLAERMLSLVLVGTSARPESPGDTRRRLDLIAQAEREGMAAASTKSMAYSCRDIGSVHPAARAGVLQSSIELGIGAFRKQQHAIINRSDSRPNLVQVKCPTLVVVGDSDMVTPRDCAEELCRCIGGASLEVVADCGHCPPLEHPGLMNNLLDAWLAGQESRSDGQLAPSTLRR